MNTARFGGRLRLLCTFFTLFLPILLLSPAVAQGQGVTWTNATNATATGSTLQKTAGCDGCEDAGASSLESLASDGFVEFTVGEAPTMWMAGLNYQDQNPTYADIDFGFRFNGGGYADVLEHGNYVPGGDTTYVVGDVFRLHLVNGRIQYLKNGRYLTESPQTPQLPLVLDASLISAGATVLNATFRIDPPAPPGGGLLETSGSPARRRRFTPTEIAAFLPPGGATGAFTFPAPYNTPAVRLTSAADCLGEQDCLWYLGYSYWRNTNNHAASTDMYIFVGTEVNRGGGGPTLIRYNKLTDVVQNLGPMFPEGSAYRWSTGEGWYFSATLPTKLYTYLVGDTRVSRFDILTRRFDARPALDLAKCPRPKVCPAGGAAITQPHSSDDDRVHTATVLDSQWQSLGCVAVVGRRYLFYATPAGFSFDECHVDKSGRWLMFLDGAPSGERINRIVDLKSGKVTIIEDRDGALGHLDMGWGYAVGADNYNLLPNATILLKFPVTTTQRPIGPTVHYNKDWDTVAANHVAHGNARPRVSPESQYACGSNASRSRVTDMADEIVCFPLDANRNSDGSLDVLSVGQVMTDLDAPGGGGDDYNRLPKGNLDVTGRYFIWTTNLGGGRLDAFLVKIPAERLGIVAPAVARAAKKKHE